MARNSEAVRKLDDRELKEVAGGDKIDLLFAKQQLERNQAANGSSNTPAGAFFYGAAKAITIPA